MSELANQTRLSGVKRPHRPLTARPYREGMKLVAALLALVVIAGAGVLVAGAWARTSCRRS